MTDFLEDIPKLNNKQIIVDVSDDKMQASVTLMDIENSVPPYTYEDVYGELILAGVKMGIDEGRIQQAISNKQFNRDIVVATGKPREDGEDGYYKFYFDTDYFINNRPKIRDDGTVDYFGSKLFEQVEEGEKLAEYIPPTKGNFGFNVKGELLTPKPGKNMPKLRGKGFTVSDDGNTYYAKITGKVEYRNYDLTISNMYNITGDVDLSTGNIDFNGDINISGSVRSGVRIHAMGSIYIGGYVEDADIKADKDVVLRDGVNANGTGKIEAGGNISGRFFENADLFARGDIKGRYMLNTKAVAYGKVIVDGSKGTIIGGDVTGIMGVDSYYIGNDNIARTTVKVGATKEVRKEYAECIMKLKELDSQIETFDEGLRKFELVKKTNPESYNPSMYAKIFQAKIVRKAEKVKYEQQSRNLFDLIKASENSVIRVMKNIYPGSSIFIEDRLYKPSAIFSHVLIKRTASAIVLREYEDNE